MPPLVPILFAVPAGAELCAGRLVAAWQDAVPAAAFFVLDEAEGGIASLMDDSVLFAPFLLAGICGGEARALTLALDRQDRACCGALICGDLDRLSSVSRIPKPARSIALRFVWETHDALAGATTLGQRLARHRTEGHDAQGIVLPHDRVGQPPASSTVRAGAAYLAELVALALGFR